MKRKVLRSVIAGTLTMVMLTGCGKQDTLKPQDSGNGNETTDISGKEESGQMNGELPGYEDTFTERDLRQVAEPDGAVYINLADNGTTVDGKGATVEGNVVTITEDGVYMVSGSLSQGQLVIDAPKEDKVQLVLQGASVTNDTSAALYVKQADKVFVTTVMGEENSFQTTGAFVAIDENNIDGAVFSKEDIIFNGEGSLNVICTSDHGIVGKDDIKVTGGALTVDAEGDGLQANDGIYIANGTVSVLNSYEGLEAQNISIWGGNIAIVAEDDGLNAAGGNDGSGLKSFGGENPFAADLSCNVVIYDGIVKIDAEGDGLDSNGNLIINGGELYVSGPTNGGNGAIDYGGSGIINGGILIATGASMMAENMSQDSNQCTMMVTLSNQMIEGEIKVMDDAGSVIMTHTPDKSFNNAVISHPDFQVGKTYTITAGEYTTEVTFDSTVYGQGMMNGGPGGGFGGFGGGKGNGGRMEDFEGGRGQRPEGERPDMGEMPEVPEGMERPDMGEMPEVPEGMERPDMGEMPEMPEGMERPGMGERPEMPGAI